jgi:hypothetical protein
VRLRFFSKLTSIYLCRHLFLSPSISPSLSLSPLFLYVERRKTHNINIRHSSFHMASQPRDNADQGKAQVSLDTFIYSPKSLKPVIESSDVFLREKKPKTWCKIKSSSFKPSCNILHMSEPWAKQQAIHNIRISIGCFRHARLVVCGFPSPLFPQSLFLKVTMLQKNEKKIRLCAV